LTMGDARFDPQAAVRPLFQATQLAELKCDPFESIVERECVEAPSDHVVRDLVRGADRERARDLIARQRLPQHGHQRAVAGEEHSMRRLRVITFLGGYIQTHQRLARAGPCRNRNHQAHRI